MAISLHVRASRVYKERALLFLYVHLLILDDANDTDVGESFLPPLSLPSLSLSLSLSPSEVQVCVLDERAV